MLLDMICKNKYNKLVNFYWNYVFFVVVYWFFFCYKNNLNGKFSFKIICVC